MDPMNYGGYPTGSVPSPLYVNHQPGIRHPGVCHVYPHQGHGMPVFYQQHPMGSTYYNYNHQVMSTPSNYTAGIQPRGVPFSGSAVHYPPPPVQPGFQYVPVNSPPPPPATCPQNFYKVDVAQPLSPQSPSVNRDIQLSSQRAGCDGAPLHSGPNKSPTPSPTVQPFRFVPPRLKALAEHYYSQGKLPVSSICNSSPSVTPNTSKSSVNTLPWISSSTSTVSQSSQSHVMPGSESLSVDYSRRTPTSTSSTDTLGSFLNTNNSGSNFNRQDLVNFYVQKHARTDRVGSPFEDFESCSELDGLRHTNTDKHVNNAGTSESVRNNHEEGTSANTVTEVINLWEEDLVDCPAKHQGKCLDNIAKASEVDVNVNVVAGGYVDNYNVWNAERVNDAEFDEVYELENDDLNYTIDSDGFIEEHEFMAPTVVHKHYKTDCKFENIYEEQMKSMEDVFPETKFNHEEVSATVKNGKNGINELYEDEMVDESEQVVDSIKTRDVNANDILHLKYEEIINKFKRQIDDEKIAEENSTHSSDKVGDLARILVKQAIANGVCKFYKALIQIKEVPNDERKMDNEVKVIPAVNQQANTSQRLYSWDEDDSQLDEDTGPVTHQHTVDTDNELKADVKQMTITPREEKGEDFEEFFFKQTASKHGITIETPSERQEKKREVGDESQCFKKPSEEDVVQLMEKKSTHSPIGFVSAKSKKFHHSISFSEDSARSSRESSVSDAVEAFKIKASLRGIHIKDESDGIPDSDLDVDSVFNLKSRSRQGSVDGEQCRFVSTPDSGSQETHFAPIDTALNGRTRHFSGLRPDALEFNPDSVISSVNVSIDGSDAVNSADTSLRLDAPEFKPDFAKTVSKLQVNAAVFEPKKKNASPKILYIPTPIEKVPNPSIGVQASPEMCSVYVGTNSTRKKESGTVTASCLSREVAVNTDCEDLRSKYPESYVVSQNLKDTKNSPMKRSIGINVHMTNYKICSDVKDQVTMTDDQTSDYDIDKAMKEVEIDAIKDKFRQLQVELMHYKEQEFNMKLSKMKKALITSKDSEAGINAQQLDSSLKLLEASVKVKRLVYSTVTSIQSGTYTGDLPDLFLLLPDTNVISQDPIPSCNNLASKESNVRHSELPEVTTSKENTADVSSSYSKQVVKKTRGMLELEDSSDDDDYCECEIVGSKKVAEQKSEVPHEKGDLDGDEKTHSSEMYSACSEFENIDEDTECESDMPTNFELNDKKIKSAETVDNTLEETEPVKTDFSQTVENLDPLHEPQLNNQTETKNLTRELGEDQDQYNAFHGAGDGNVAIDIKYAQDAYASVDKISKLMHEEYSNAINSVDTVWYFNGDVGSHVNGDVETDIGEEHRVRCDDKSENVNNNAGNIDSQRRHGIYNKAEQGVSIRHRQERIVTPLNEDADMAGGDHLYTVETLKDSNDSKEASKGYSHEFGDGANPKVPPGLTTSDIDLQMDSDEVYLSPEKQPSTMSTTSKETVQINPNIDSDDETNIQSDSNASMLPSMAATGSNVVGMSPLPVMMNNLNPALYQAVLAQLIQSYPQLASNQEMLTKVAMQQTYLLQMYINNQAGNTRTPSGPNCLLESQNISANAFPSITGGMGEYSNTTEQSSFPSSSIPSSAHSSSSSSMSKSAAVTGQNAEGIRVDNVSSVLKTREESLPVNKPPGFTLEDDLNITSVDINDGCKSDHDLKSRDEDASKQFPDPECMSASQADVNYSDSSSVAKMSDDNSIDELRPIRLPHNATQTRKVSGFRPKEYVAKESEDKASVNDRSTILNDNESYRAESNDMKSKQFSSSMPTSKTESSNTLDDIRLFENAGSISNDIENSLPFSKISSDSNVKGRNSEKFSDSKPMHHASDTNYTHSNAMDEFRYLPPSPKEKFGSSGNDVTSGRTDLEKGANSHSVLSSSTYHSSTSEKFIPPNLPPRLRKKQKENRSQVSPNYSPQETWSNTPSVGLSGSTASNFGQRGAQSTVPSFGKRGAQSTAPSFGQQGAQSTAPSFGQRGAQSTAPSFGQRGAQSTASNFGQRGAQSSAECWDDEVDDYADTFSLQIQQRPLVIKPDKSKNLAADQTNPFISAKKPRSRATSSSSMSTLDDIQPSKLVKPDPVHVAKTKSETSEEWCEVQTRRRRHSSKDQQREKRKISIPDVNRAPARTQSKSLKMSNFERLVGRLQDTYPDADRQAIIMAIGKIRDSRGSLSGLSMEAIIEKANLYISKKSNKSSMVPPSSKSETTRRIPGLNYEKPKHQTLNLPKFMPSTVTSSCDEEICVICHDPLTSEPVKELDCRHVFHTDCISQWVQQERTCPTCRTHALFPEDFPRLGK